MQNSDCYSEVASILHTSHPALLRWHSPWQDVLPVRPQTPSHLRHCWSEIASKQLRKLAAMASPHQLAGRSFLFAQSSTSSSLQVPQSSSRKGRDPYGRASKGSRGREGQRPAVSPPPDPLRKPSSEKGRRPTSARRSSRPARPHGSSATAGTMATSRLSSTLLLKPLLAHSKHQLLALKLIQLRRSHGTKFNHHFFILLLLVIWKNCFFYWEKKSE